MFKNHLLVAWRNIIRNKIFSLINVLGLSIGISSALVIFLIVHYEFGFDRFEKDGGRIYRVVTNSKFEGNPYFFPGVPQPLADAVKKEVTGLEETVAFHQSNHDPKVSVPQLHAEKPVVFKDQPDIIYADNSYFRLIPYRWLAGSPKTALSGPYKVVLTEQRARAYFPGNPADVLGKQIIYDDSIITTVTGVVKNLDQSTDFGFKEFISQSTISGAGLENYYGWDSWGAIFSGSQLFLKLNAGTSPGAVESQLAQLLKEYNKNANRDEKNTTDFRLQPLQDLHFNARYGTFGDHTAHKPTLYGLLIVAAFLLFLGCINFINLSTAQAIRRAKEIGIRKTMGSSRKQLIFQFLCETFLICLVSMLISLAIVPLLLNIFGDFIPKDLHFNLMHPGLISFLAGLVITISLLAGFYPALVLSGYKPVLVLKNQAYIHTAVSRKALLRKSLTIVQFFIAQVFVMATLITVKQIHYVLNKDMGFKKDAIINFSTPANTNHYTHPDSKRYVLINELKALPGIQMLSLGGPPPSTAEAGSISMSYQDGKNIIHEEVSQRTGDTNYLSLYQIPLVAGRNLRQSDSAGEYIVNETFMHLLGIQHPQDLINKNISGRPVVGVMADFNPESLHSPLVPIAFSANTRYNHIFHVALKPQAATGILWSVTIGKIEKIFKNIYPEEDFRYSFLDESIAKYYKSEEDISRLLKWATGLAIFISCIGLLGLVIFTTNIRIKEIGIRKVLGASVGQIISILSKDFLRLVLIAFLLAIPLAWWIMNKWLENFAYRTTLNWWVFAISGVAMMLIAVLTLSIQTIKAAGANPVESLRNE